MKSHIESQFDRKPTNRLRKFFSLVSNHLITSYHHNLKQITNEISNLSIERKQFVQNQVSPVKKVNQDKQISEMTQQVKLPEKSIIYQEEKSVKFKGMENIFNSLMLKQKHSFQQLIDNLNSKDLNSSNTLLVHSGQMQSHYQQKLPITNAIDGQELQKKKISQEEQFITQKPSIMQETEEFCNSLRQLYNDKVYNKDWMSEFVYNLQEIVKNNAYICVQDTFQTLKQNYWPQNNNSSPKQKQLTKRSSSRINPSDTLQFNLQLTIKSKNSKHSFNFDPRDSLTYSNTTSFGLASSENRSKPSNRNDGSTRFLPPSNVPSLKMMKSSRDENDTDIAHIQRTESRGDVSGQNSRQQTPNNLLINKIQSQKALVQNDKDKGIIEIKDDQIHDSKVKLTPISINHPPVKQDKDCGLAPLTQLKQASQQNEDKMERQWDTNKKSTKKSPSINHHSDRLKISRKSTQKIMKDNSLFANEISHFEDRISRIKQAKLAKKLQLQEQLKRINNEIQDLKLQESQQQINEPTKRQKQIQRQNTFESRIKINDNSDKKKQAINLVRSLRAEKLSRENQKRRKIKVLDTDLHKEIQDIMKLKYFNEERLKEKKKLEIIERMKQQQIRKIEEQKRKQESLQFLAKLKGIERQRQIDNFEKVPQENKVKENHYKSRDYYSKSQNNVSSFDHPNKIVSPKQQDVRQTPTINEKKKSYVSRRLNPSIKRRINEEDKYEQVLR